MAKRKRNDAAGASGEKFSINPFSDFNFGGDFPVAPETLKNDLAQDKNPVDVVAALSNAIYIRLVKKGRGGKTVTMLTGFDDGNSSALDNVARELRKQLGTGGTRYDDTIELQGDCRRETANWLKAKGFKVKGDVDTC